jgi:hypothetical protein
MVDLTMFFTDLTIGSIGHIVPRRLSYVRSVLVLTSQFDMFID